MLFLDVRERGLRLELRIACEESYAAIRVRSMQVMDEDRESYR